MCVYMSNPTTQNIVLKFNLLQKVTTFYRSSPHSLLPIKQRFLRSAFSAFLMGFSQEKIYMYRRCWSISRILFGRLSLGQEKAVFWRTGVTSHWICVAHFDSGVVSRLLWYIPSFVKIGNIFKLKLELFRLSRIFSGVPTPIIIVKPK